MCYTPPLQLSYPLYLSLSMLLCIQHSSKAMTQKFLFSTATTLCNFFAFCWFSRSGFWSPRKKDGSIVKRQTPILRERTSLCEVPVAHWSKQSVKAFSWCSGLTLPTGAKTLQCRLLHTHLDCVPYIAFPFEVFPLVVLSLIPQFLKRAE